MWVGANGGDAHRRRPLSVALGQENCGFRAAAIKALTKARMPWRAICQFGSLESVFATLEADMAIALFLSPTCPDRLAVLRGCGARTTAFSYQSAPAINRHDVGGRGIARHIREGFSSRYG